MSDVLTNPAAGTKLIGLFEYIEKNLTTDNTYEAKSEILAARHSLIAHRLAYDGCIQKVQELNRAGTPIPQEYLNLLLIASDKLRSDVKEFVSILKTVAEVDILASSKMDAVQVLALLSQVPVIISEYLTDALTNLSDDFKKHITASVPAEFHNSPWFADLTSYAFIGNESSEMAIAELVVHITSNLHNRIKELNVPGSNTSEEASARDKAVMIEEVTVMRNCVPTEPTI